jgi:hypothetical protein
MNHPVLKIRKGASVYDDSEPARANAVPRPARPGDRPSAVRRRRGRRARLTFFPLLVVALGLFVVFRAAPRAPGSRAVLEGWQVILRVSPSPDGLNVGITFIAAAADRVPIPAPAEARVSLPGTAESIILRSILEKSPMTLRGSLPRLPGAAQVQAEVGIGAGRAVLRAAVP